MQPKRRSSRTDRLGTREKPWKRTVTALLLFGAAFGYLEAAVVSYLRLLHEPARQRFYPGRAPGELFPLLTLEQLRAAGGEQQRILGIELGREGATIVMLAAIALAVADNAGQWAAAFAIAFGTWDIAFYAFLRVLLDWPASLFTWDILFLIPVPWAGPVLAPVIVSAAMIAAGVCHLRSEARLERIRIGAEHWAGIIAGASVIVASFALDYRNLLAGGAPHMFSWTLFASGMTIGVASYAWAMFQSARTNRSAIVSMRSLEGSPIK
jgi:hypothetical protein